MERYEFRDGSSNKYWEVAVEADTLIVRYGKIGTDGQTKEKAFANAAAAEKEKAKLVKEKTGKGYVSAGASTQPLQRCATASPQIAVAPVAASPTKAAVAGTTSSPQIMACTPAATDAAGEAWAAFKAAVDQARKKERDFWYVEWPADLADSNSGKPLMADAVQLSRRLIKAASEVLVSRERRDPPKNPITQAVDIFMHYTIWIAVSSGRTFATELGATLASDPPTPFTGAFKDMLAYAAEHMSPASDEVLPSATVSPTRTPASIAKPNSQALPTRLRPAAPVAADVAWNKYAAKLIAASKRKHEHWYVQWPSIDAEQNPGKLSMVEATKISGRLINAAQQVYITGAGSDALYRRGREAVEVFTYFSHWIVATCGGAYAMQLAEVQRRQMLKEMDWWRDAWISPAAIGMRNAITAAPEAEYEAALAWSLEHARTAKDIASRVTLAFILADDRPTQHALKVGAVLAGAEAQPYDMTDSLFVPLIAEVAADNGKRWHTQTGTFDASRLYLSPTAIAATILQTARMAEQSPQPVLDWMTANITTDYDEAGNRLAWLCGMLEARDDNALTALLPHLNEAPVRKALDAATADDPAWTFRACLSVLVGGRKDPLLLDRVLKIAEDHGIDAARTWATEIGADARVAFDTMTAVKAALAAADQVPKFLMTPPWRQSIKAQAQTVLAIAPITQAFVFSGKVPAIDVNPYDRGIVITDDDHLVRWIAEKEAYIDGEPERHREAKQQYAMTLKGLRNGFGLTDADIADFMPMGFALPKSPERPGPVPSQGMTQEEILAWLAQRMKQLSDYGSELVPRVHQQPYDLGLLLWHHRSGRLAQSYQYQKPTLVAYFAAMLARYGTAAVPDVVAYIQFDPVAFLPHCLDFNLAEIAPIAAQMALTRAARRGGDDARRWLRQNAELAALRLLPDAVGAPGAKRNAAETAIRFLVADHADAVNRAMAAYTPEHPKVAAALAEVLGRDPMDRIPKKPAPIPNWLSVSRRPRPILKSGGALPDEAMITLIEMVSFINPDDVYAGVPALKEACTAESLAAFAWSLFESWIIAGAPSKEAWAFRTLGWFGDDECARKLTKLIRKWPGEAAHARAVTGLDVLSDIGSDVALMCLNGIAEKVAFKGLQNKAREKIQSLAETRGLTADELADRLVPDLDLDERGGLDLDFGPRQFRVGFDEFLKPWVKDSAGKRLKDLPKPIKSDEADKADAASKRWSALKKDARAIASLQLTRLETMLASGRRAKPATFQMFFAAHPLVRHLAQRLVWGVYDDETVDAVPQRTFRVTEELAFTSASDDPIEMDVSETASTYIGLVHPLHMSEADATAWGTLFGDYEISQPFAQLGREVYALTEAERGQDEITRFAKSRIDSKRVRGLAARGWRTGQPQDGGGIMWMERAVRLPDGSRIQALLHLPDGLIAGMASEEEPTQELGVISFDGGGYFGSRGRRLAEIDAVTASEILRDVIWLVESSKK